ncbi:hypothetical protein BDA96_01G441500 [Sorghum bicolor]|uniref:Uncharacterized protein n=1 Tax=Sorghum bicolor TaxID=4558 RepID=A0A921V1E9_SORBI|nr:hypothetical protein BDA96_01G441500 [Sorghum bicolor]
MGQQQQQQQPCAPAARRAAGYTVVRCSSLPEGPAPQLQLPPPIRRSANYQPNSWNYDSLESSLAGCNKRNREGDPSSFDKLKFRVRHLLLQQEVEILTKLRVIDTVQRLGVAYHFDDEISAILNSVSTEKQDVDRVDDVRLMTLSFRLLRQNNYPVSPEVVLRSLKDGTGNFKKTLQKDTEGLLSLYEASHLAFEGDHLLDEARAVLHPHLRSSVDNALAVPLHWAAPRLQARWFINHYARDSDADLSLLHFAKLDFNNVQKLQQQELSRITRWWRNADLSESLPFARDRLMECFYFATGVAPEPSLEACREVVAKTFALIVLLDDIYDIYGTLDELVMFTDAIERWGTSASEQLPEYMKAIYLTIVSTSNEVAEHVLRQEGCDARFLLKKAWHDLCKAFLMEAKWHYSNYKPTLHEYLENGWISVSGPLMLIHAFPIIEKKGVTPNSIQQLESYPKLVQMVSKIFRLCNDSATHSEELKRGDAPSSIAIYMSENRATEHDARKAMRDLTMETWKTVNQDAFSNCRFPLPFANACVNMARISHCIYRGGGDGISAPDDEKMMEIKELFLQPFKVEN